MSDYYRYSFTFALSPETPVELTEALRLLSEGQRPSKEQLAAFPGLPQIYLSGNTGAPGDGVHALDNGVLRLSQTFHDDEFFNGGEYFVWWLLQFAGHDGPLGTVQQTNGLDMPEVLIKKGDLLLTARVDMVGGADLQPSPEPVAGPEGPVRIGSTQVASITQMLEELRVFRDGYEYM